MPLYEEAFSLFGDPSYDKFVLPASVLEAWCAPSNLVSCGELCVHWLGPGEFTGEFKGTA